MPNHAQHRARTPDPLDWVATDPPPEGGAGGDLFDRIEYRFWLCGQGPAPLSVDGRALGHGLPPRRIPLVELSAVLLHPSCSYAAREAVWRHLLAKARTGEDTWVAGAVGVALPGLRYRAYLLGLHTHGRGDVASALLVEFLRALRTLNVDQPPILSTLLASAFSAARSALRDEEPATAGEASFAPTSVAPPAVFGHPDFVLGRAVRAGVISHEESELIGAIRLEGLTVAQYALRAGVSRWKVYRMLRPAQDRLVAAIQAGVLSDPDAEVIAEATLTTIAEPSRHRTRP
jgi:predicted DNA-binding protein (UPF0251 family)